MNGAYPGAIHSAFINRQVTIRESSSHSETGNAVTVTPRGTETCPSQGSSVSPILRNFVSPTPRRPVAPLFSARTTFAVLLLSHDGLLLLRRLRLRLR